MGRLEYTAVGLGSAIRDKKVGVLEALETVLAQIKEKEAALHCYVTIDEDGARGEAREVQKRIDSGELTGTARVGAQCIKAFPCRNRRRGAARRTARHMLFMIRITGHAKRGRFRRGAHCKFIHICFSYDDRARLLQLLHDMRRIFRYKISKHPGRTCGPHPPHTQIIFERDRHARKRSGKFPAVNPLLHLFFGRLRGGGCGRGMLLCTGLRHGRFDQTARVSLRRCRDETDIRNSLALRADRVRLFA